MLGEPSTHLHSTSRGGCEIHMPLACQARAFPPALAGTFYSFWASICTMALVQEHCGFALPDEKGQDDSAEPHGIVEVSKSCDKLFEMSSADIWSVGCTIIEMATGKPSWSQQFEEVAGSFHIGTTRHPPIPDFLSSEATSFLLKCLQKRGEFPSEKKSTRLSLAASECPDAAIVAQLYARITRLEEENRGLKARNIQLVNLLVPPSPTKGKTFGCDDAGATSRKSGQSASPS
ncbi:Mitogen-activated protein kinase kinase kinase NPK1 [Platanthera guangdongensis]|uniref:Mitogen-activated protein kinase kinase kinase NPK1 n=1 Tax=Platanthera guangdongensis TaxID=2320717 RepID=A0ABR2LC92_9ASPA